jgi:SAM-dependent methyltransferase
MGFVAGNPTTEAFSDMAGVYVDLSRPARRLLAMADLQPAERVIDVGCGPGTVAVAAAELVGDEGQVVAVDLAPGMLTRAREVAAGSENVEVLPMDARALAFSDASFDAVVANSVVQVHRSLLSGRVEAGPPPRRQAGVFVSVRTRGVDQALPEVRRSPPRAPAHRDDRPSHCSRRCSRRGQGAGSPGIRHCRFRGEQVVRNYRSAEDAFSDEYRHGARILLEALPDDALAEFKTAYIEAVSVSTGAEIPFQFHFWCFR